MHNLSAKMTCDELRQLYFEMRDRVFKNPKWGLNCDTQALEKLIKARFGEEMTMADVEKPK